jgi:hypothetical protein
MVEREGSFHMVNKELRKYLSCVLEAERNVLILKNAAKKMYGNIQRLGQAKSISTPYESKVDTGKSVGRFFGWGICCLVVGLIVGGIIAMSISANNRDSVPVTINGRVSGYIEVHSDSFDPSIMVVVTVVGALIGLGIGIAIAYFITASKLKETKNYNNKRQEEYSDALAQDKNRVSRELSTKDNAMQHYNTIRKQLTASQRVLDNLYSLNIIHNEFRNIIAIASFYQYIDTGMCDTLKEAKGFFFHESWYRKLSSQLDDIIYRLDQIQDNQFILLRTVKSANEKVDRLTKTSELTLSYAQATAHNSEIMAYNTEVTARNTEFLKYMEFWKSVMVR